MAPNSRRPARPTLAFVRWGWVAYALALWQVLLWAQNPGLMADDSGEMAAAACQLGLPHPPGYPLFNLLGHLVCAMPLGTPAFRLNLLSALLALFSLFLTLVAAQKMGGPTLKPAKGRGIEGQGWLLAAMGLAFLSSRNLFSQSLTAKGCLYTLTLLFTTAAIWLYLANQNRPQDNRPLLGAFFLWGLGMASHWQTHILWIPFLAVWCRQSRSRLKARIFLVSAALVLCGLSLYLYLPLRARLDCLPSWGYPVQLRLFYWVVSRQLVSGVEHWVQNAAFYLQSAGEMARVVWLYWLPGSAALSLLGSYLLWKNKRPVFYGLAALFVPAFLGIFAIHEQQNIYLIPVYLVSLTGMMVLCATVASRWIQVVLPWAWAGFLWLAVLGLASAGWLSHVARLEDKSGYLLSDHFGLNVMKALPKDSILLADGDHYVMPIWYEKYARGLRPDLVFEPSVFLYHGWGWKQLADQSADLKPLVFSSNLSQERLDALARAYPTHRLFCSLGHEDLEPALDRIPGTWVPRGLVYALEPRKTASDRWLKQAFRVIRDERWNSLAPDGEGVETDTSSRQIYGYYGQQFTVLKP